MTVTLRWLPLVLGVVGLWGVTGCLPGTVRPDEEVEHTHHDYDGDGYCEEDPCSEDAEPGDCDDEDATVYPGADEGCNGVDNDCDGAPAEDEVDVDGDGAMVCDGDCDDGDADVYPGADEGCDGIDTDCDGAAGEEEVDLDADGYMVCAGDCDDLDPDVHLDAEEVCNGIDDDCDQLVDEDFDADGDGVTTCEGDCDDEDAAVFPGQAEEVCNGVDDDCDPYTEDEPDDDHDGYSVCEDCDDTTQQINPGLPEVTCDGLDNDCDATTEDTPDADGDGYTLCDECDDANPDVHPGMAEVTCNGLDDDCDASTADEPDADGDGYSLCTDCDDADGTVHPGMGETVCNGIDDDCDATTEDEPDADGDGYTVCDDCDDADASANPGEVEVECDFVDNDCDPSTPDELGTHYTDTYIQEGSYQADVLFVVDNSCSMSDFQLQLAVQFEFMLDAMVAAGIDYHVAVATTDDGNLQGATPVIDGSIPDPLGMFAINSAVGTMGSGLERGLQYGWEALQLADAGVYPNDGFLRDDASLHLVMVSDEEDQSIDTVTGYVSGYQSLKVDPDMVYVNGFTGQLTGCGSASPGVRYEQAVSMTGGVSESVCALDWSAAMEDIADQASVTALQDTFALTHQAIAGSVEVAVDGVPQVAGWAYDEVINAVVFDPASVPVIDAVIDIDYEAYDTAMDSFTQESNTDLDVLFVVDNSCSMYEEQMALAVEFEYLLDAMVAEGIDYHVGVVTTDDPALQGANSVIDASLPDPLGAFAAATAVGTVGSGMERGLQYGLEALQMADAGIYPNDGFLRDDAILHVVVVSDEDDQSTGTVTDYVADISSLKADPSMAFISGFTGQMTGCASAYMAPRYEQAIGLTGGVSESICSPGWDAAMEDIAGLGGASGMDSFVLSQVPIEASIRVYVNNAEQTTGWTFDPYANAVVFDPGHVPYSGDDIEIEYAYSNC